MLDPLPARCGDASACAALGDARLLVTLEGQAIRQVLAKGVPLDLHPSAFPPGSAALAGLGQLQAHLWLEGGGRRFHLAVASSTAGDFAHWLTGATAEFGLEIDTGDRG
ncbi:hypothetical protein BH23PSE1_BH23PSE1_03420 [soil metagenome]